MERERVVENELGEQDVKLDVLLLSERSRQALVGGGLQLQGSRNLKIMPLLQQRKRCARGLRLLRFHLILHLLYGEHLDRWRHLSAWGFAASRPVGQPPAGLKVASYAAAAVVARGSKRGLALARRRDFDTWVTWTWPG